jgi:CubicO group peptidase (beta-lactamase class C family)
VFWDLFGHRPTAYAPFGNPVYSNIGFTLIGWAVERATNISFAEYVDVNIWAPTGMHRTFATCPDDILGVIPVNSKWWNATFGFETA